MGGAVWDGWRGVIARERMVCRTGMGRIEGGLVSGDDGCFVFFSFGVGIQDRFLGAGGTGLFGGF